MKLPKLPKRDTLGAFEGVSVFQRWQTLLSTVSCANGLQLAKKDGQDRGKSWTIPGTQGRVNCIQGMEPTDD